MPFQISPGVVTREFNLTTVVPAVSTTEGAIAGVFRWGPVGKRILVDSEQNLVQNFGAPTNLNPETWFTAADFLSYGNKLYVSRAADTTGNNFTKTYDGNTTAPAIAASDVVLKLSNTENLSVGMKLAYSNNDALPIGATILSVNSTTVSLSDSATANVEDVSVVFRENIPYTAVAVQSDLNLTIADISDWDEQIVRNDNHYDSRETNGDAFDASVLFVAKYPGEMGNSLRVCVCDTAEQFSSNVELTPNAQINATATKIVANVGSNTISVTVTPADVANATNVTAANVVVGAAHTILTVGDLLEVGNSTIGLQHLQITNISNILNVSNTFSFTISVDDKLKLRANSVNTRVRRFWEFYNVVDVAPAQSDYVLQFGNTAAQDELHVVVVDEGGKFSGSPGTVIEVHRNLSRATDAKGAEGGSIYYKDVINKKSSYIWFANDRTTAKSNTANFVTSSSASDPLSMRLIGGDDGLDEATVSFSTIASAYEQFISAEDSDISLIMQGKARGEAVSHYTQLGNFLIDNIAEVRKDCVVFISPDKADVVNNENDAYNDIVDFRNELRSTSYAVLDSGYKYRYDKYNDVYRWTPLNGDIAGLCARTDLTNDPWWSPAGFNRGNIKNIVRLAYNPRKAHRDILYKAGVNPVVTFPGQGTILYGDKTLLAQPSAFDRINVRRLFIVLEKAISIAAKYSLFEFNDEFTRAQFKNLVNPFLRDVQGRRGITEFLVVCDKSNNPGSVVDRNEFVGDIYIKPARSINFITLNFVAVGTDVSFSEVVGKFGG